MKKISFVLIMLTAILNINAQKADNLRCEYLNNPLGVDSKSPRFSWIINDDSYGAVQVSYQLIVGDNLEDVSDNRGNYWNTGRIYSNKMLDRYKGIPLKPYTKYYWRVNTWDKSGKMSSSSIASFETGMMESKNWQGYWISDGQHLNGYGIDEKSAPYFRKEFGISGKISSARAYIAVAGLYELYINGKKVGDHRLDPMFTRFDRRNLYVTYDVTGYLQNGQNAIGVLLGNGWYNLQSYAVWYFDRAPWRNRPTFCMDLRIVYEDGSVETVISDRDWKTALSPITFNSIYTAEHYDARLEQQGWNKAGFNDSGWKTEVVYRQAPSQNIVSQQLHPIRNVEKIPAKSFKKINDQRYIYDLGRNIAGVSQFKVKGEAGTKIYLKHAEILRPNDSLYMQNIEEHYRPIDDSDPFQTDIFILNGKGEETFMPLFNYKGFQYVEVTSDKPIELNSESLIGWFMHSDVPPVGSIESSNPIINKIWYAANNSYLSNLFGYPTDCPQREKNGWTGDGNYAVDLGLFNYDGITIYEKWLADHQDAQEPNGLLPNIIPTSGWGLDWATGPEWTGSIAIIPWAIYEFYGDTTLLSNCYNNIKLYVNRLNRLSPNGLCNQGLGDWIPVKSQTPQQYTTSIYYYRVVSILAKTARLLGFEEDHTFYSSLAEKIKTAINNEYLNTETGIYGSGNQTEMSTALHWGIVPENLKNKVAANLAERVKADDNHLDVGFLGTKTILYALSENGYADLAYTLASQTTYPSFGYWIVKDKATTLYEFWKTIGETKELSLNHILFGEVNAWLYKTLGGINPDPSQPGFKNVILKPCFVNGLNLFKASYHSPRGLIISNWEKKNKSIIYHVTIPANTSAEFYLSDHCKVNKITVSNGDKIELAKNDNKYWLPAGSYTFHLIQK